jgi:hypothetical protein
VQLTLFALTATTVQFCVHEPQWVTSFRTFVSQPVLPLEQCAKPLAHDHEHTLDAQLGVPFRRLQALPQLPQLSGSRRVSMQRP